MGEVLDGNDVRSHFSRDSSIFQIEPSVIVYPKNEQDVRKVLRFVWQLCEKGKVIPITSRGAGSDLTGASIGEGIILVFPAHMNRVVHAEKETIKVEPGATVSKVQQSFNIQYRFFPPATDSAEYSTVGGAVANNSGGLYSYKYGDTSKYVKGLRVTLANGEVITIGKLSKREYSKKMGLANFEGKIYRELDALLTDNQQLIKEGKNVLSSTGYNLQDVLGKNGTADLTPLFVGSQGTLGVITEVELTSEVYNPQPATVLIQCDDLDQCLKLVDAASELKPAAIEMVDNNTIRQIRRLNQSILKGVLDGDPKFVLIVEFDDNTDRSLKRSIKKLTKICVTKDLVFKTGTTDEERDNLWKVRNAVGHIMTDTSSKGRVIPAVEGATVPLDKYKELYEGAAELFKTHRLPFMAWGHIGQGQLSLLPKIELAETSGRQRIFRFMDDYFALVFSLGGSSGGLHNDGRIRGQYAALEHGQEMYGLLKRVKTILDPYGMLNPGVKVDVDRKHNIGSLRSNHSFEIAFRHLPRI